MRQRRPVVTAAVLLALVAAGCSAPRSEPAPQASPSYAAHVIDVPNAPKDADFDEFCALHDRAPSDGSGESARRFGLDLLHLGTPASFDGAARRGLEGTVGYLLRADPEDDSFEITPPPGSGIRGRDAVAYRAGLLPCADSGSGG